MLQLWQLHKLFSQHLQLLGETSGQLGSIPDCVNTEVRGHPFMTSTKKSGFRPPSPCPHGPDPPPPPCGRPHEIHTALLKQLVQ